MGVRPTSSNRFTSRCASTNSTIFPLTIHSETIAKSLSSIVTPNSESTFGWWRVFHVTTSLQKIYVTTAVISCSVRTFDKPRVMTHTRNLIEIACRVYSQNLDCNLATLVFAYPHIGIPAAAQWSLQLVKTERDLEWTRKQRMATTYLAQCVHTLLLQLRSQALQCLLGMRSGW